MNILDENIIESQCLLLRSWGIKIRRIGYDVCLLYTSPSPRDLSTSRMPSSA